MQAKPLSYSSVLTNSFISVVCSLLLGVAFNGLEVFVPQSTAFEFVVYGILGSLFFFTLRINVRNAFAILLILLFVNVGLVNKSWGSVFLIRDVIFFFVVSASIYFFFVFFYRPMRQDKKLEPLIFATVYGLAFLVSWFLLHLTFNAFRKMDSFEEVRFSLVPLLENGFLIGLGVGLGILIVDLRLVEKILERFSTKHAG